MSPTSSARYHARRRALVLSLLPAGCPHVPRDTSESPAEIDHVHGDGDVERALYGHAEFITRILRNTRPSHLGPLQVLCPPCHKAKTASR